MYTGSLPPASIYGTWRENIELISAEDDTPYDTSVFTEATVQLIDPVTKFPELTLKLSTGQVYFPQAGVMEWRAEADVMGTLASILYEVLILLYSDTDTVPLVIGSVSIVD